MSEVYIEEFVSVEKQMCKLSNHHWSVARLISLSKDLPIMDVPLSHLNLNIRYTDLRIRDMVMHINATNESDLNFPIILDEDGEVMDGRHRIIKALVNGNKTIKAVRFCVNPSPCKID